MERLLVWPNLNSLLVSIDGLRDSATDEEKNWRLATIREAERVAESDSRVQVHVWQKNSGLTDHAVRIMSKSLETSYGFIAIEEDNLIHNEGLDFLNLTLGNRPEASIATAFTSQSHLPTNIEHRYSFFPEQWSTALNQPIFETFIKIWNDKTVDRALIRSRFAPIFGRNIVLLELVTEKWFQMFKLSVLDPSYGDALMAYAAIFMGVPFATPMKSLVTDIGSLDSRGLHLRREILIRESHSISSLNSHGYNFCRICEKENSGITGTGALQSMQFISRKIKKSLHLLDSPQHK
jgi:hypothetical protein